MPDVSSHFFACLLLALVALATAQYHVPLQGSGQFGIPGCGIAHDPGYHFRYPNGSNFSVPSGGLQRYYSVQVPKAYDANHSYALIMDFHGNSDNSTVQRNNSQYFNHAASQQYLVVYPQGYNKSFQGADYATSTIDDLQFTTDLLAHIESEYCIDPNRVYASGKSNGGGFVNLLACSEQGDSFAAFAMASAALYHANSTSCDKKRAVLESHGDGDTVIPYIGNATGHGGPLPDVGDWVRWWGQRDCGEDAVATVTGDLGGYNITSYSCGAFQNVTQHYHFAALGHCWPDAQGDNYDALKLKSQHCGEIRVLDYTSVVLEFFANWSLANAPQNC